MGPSGRDPEVRRLLRKLQNAVGPMAPALTPQPSCPPSKPPSQSWLRQAVRSPMGSPRTWEVARVECSENLPELWYPLTRLLAFHECRI